MKTLFQIFSKKEQDKSPQTDPNAVDPNAILWYKIQNNYNKDAHCSQRTIQEPSESVNREENQRY